MDAQPDPISPIYERLPHGPHRLERGEVARNQRARLLGAMIEAVARHGYPGTSVKHVIGLAGVSRRSFYEQFANKQDCMLATFDVLVDNALSRVRASCAETSGEPAERLRTALGSLLAEIDEAPAPARLVLVEADAVGREAMLRLRRTSTRCEDLLAAAACAQGGGAPTRPLLRALVGGVHGAAAARLREGASQDPGALFDCWVVPLLPAPDSGVYERLRACTDARARELALLAARSGRPLAGPAHGAQRRRAHAGRQRSRVSRRERGPWPGAHESGHHAPVARAGADDRMRLIESAMALASSESYAELTMPQVADEAGTPLDRCLELFEHLDACMLAAVETVGVELATAAEPARDWPGGVPAAVQAIVAHLARHPSHARTLAETAFCAGPAPAAAALAAMRELAARLTGPPHSPAACAAGPADALAGALLHSVRCHLAGDCLALLEAVGEQLAYAALAPALGASRAVDVALGGR